MMISAGTATAGAIADTGVGFDTVGSVDTLLSQTVLENSGDETVADWINSVLDDGYALTGTDLLSTDVVASEWLSVTGTGNVSTFAHQLTTDPEFFLIKTGNVTNPDYRFFLYENIGELDWAVIDLGADGMNFLSITNIGGVSHITEVSPVPEPATMLLFGTGLVGLAGGRLRKKKK